MRFVTELAVFLNHAGQIGAMPKPFSSGRVLHTTNTVPPRHAAALELHKKLKLIHEGENPYDIFVRWKSLDQQPIGWEPDLNDGVRLNIRPFVEAGILRKKPNIKWNKDKGRDPESAPWFHLFKGDRINDHQLTWKRSGARGSK